MGHMVVDWLADYQQHPDRYPGIPLWAMWVRLPLQLPLIWWAWRYTWKEM